MENRNENLPGVNIELLTSDFRKKPAVLFAEAFEIGVHSLLEQKIGKVYFSGRLGREEAEKYLGKERLLQLAEAWEFVEEDILWALGQSK